MTIEELLEKYAAGVRDFTGVDLSEANLSGVNLSGADLSDSNLSVANCSGANLSECNLSRAKLNVTRLSGVNFSNANLNHASLNVTNLMRADLSHAQLVRTTLIRSELIRAELSWANLSGADLSRADIREATLRYANLRRANLTEANLRGSLLAAANLEEAHLNGSDLRRADFSGANLRGAELRQVNLSYANLSGANLSGVNLRWSDLSGANLHWADLSEAKLTGANLAGADLSHANLLNASLVHADLTQARLTNADWMGVNLSGATLTGAKLYAVSRFGLKTEGMTCEWIDLSPEGDRSVIQQFNAGDFQSFFNETPPTVRLIIDAPLEKEANLALATAYYQIAQQNLFLNQPPSIQVGLRRTILTFQTESDESLFAAAYLAILPFSDAEITQRNILTVVEMTFAQGVGNLNFIATNEIGQLKTALNQVIAEADIPKKGENIQEAANKTAFFQAPTQTVLINSKKRSLIIHQHSAFGKGLMNSASWNDSVATTFREISKFLLPPLDILMEFVKDFHDIE